MVVVTQGQHKFSTRCYSDSPTPHPLTPNFNVAEQDAPAKRRQPKHTVATLKLGGGGLGDGDPWSPRVAFSSDTNVPTKLFPQECFVGWQVLLDTLSSNSSGVVVVQQINTVNTKQLFN